MQLHTSAPANSKGGTARIIGLVMALFFAFGFCTVLVDTIIPKLKATFALSYAEVMLTQFCFLAPISSFLFPPLGCIAASAICRALLRVCC